MANNYAEMVKTSPLAAELDDAQIAILADLISFRSLTDGEVLLREGDISNELFIIASGGLAVTRDNGAGDWVMLHLLRTHDLAGELGFLDNLEHCATLRANGSTQVFSLSRDKLEGLIATHPEVVYRVMRAIMREVHSILRRMNVQYVEMTNYISKRHGRY